MTKKTRRTIWWVLAVLLLAVISYAVYYFTSIYNGLEGLKKEGDASPFSQVEQIEAAAPEPPKWEGTEPVSILIMGVDGRGVSEGEIPRSDSMMVATLDPTQKKIYLFSILRDTYVDIPEYRSDRINTAITHGPNTAMNTISELLGIPVQYYVYTDFQGFIKLVDAIGGVDFYVEKDMKYSSKADNHEFDINLKQGQQHLDGDMALQYVRFRHDALSDFTRTGRQRDFVKAVAEKMISTTSIMKLPTILEEVSPFVDTNLSINDMWKLATIGYQSSMSSSEQIPPMDMLAEETIGGASVIAVKDLDELQQFVQDTLNPPVVETDPLTDPGVESMMDNEESDQTTN
ncbi:LCP family protein [Paenibacillus crassostreae]|uniref:Transcriptional regulator n=1 Tax=Paenibacillus crassostreae TaxID=1763538 RepID=A0A167CU21_9BACL|nr:LCP family protein [Paenibacillus crassostreae]AOZ93554.1 transcriptional regulator [Paenibacillus crassostreae]OAB73574.1 transcriptional regulator [Paenibacillus crassostreae]